MAEIQATCSVVECAKAPHARGLCTSHYAKRSRAGDLPALADRDVSFWSKVDKSGPNGCWVWTAHRILASRGAG